MQFVFNGEVVSYSRYRIMMDIFGNEQAIRNLDKFKDLLKIDVEFDGKPIDALVVDMSGDNPIVQLMIPRKCKFDSLTNKWKNSSIRKILNSDEFIWLFNEEFSKIVRPTVVHTENYTTTDTFWFLSHEEIGYADENKWFNPNLNTRKFDAFDGTKQCRIRKIAQFSNKWWSRSSYSCSDCYVACVYDGGSVYNTTTDDYFLCLPVCSIG